MVTEISLAIIAASLVMLAVALIRISLQTRQAVQLLQDDVHMISIEMVQLLHSINEFVRTDLHAVSTETTQLASKLTDLSSDLDSKSHSLNFLFKPFSFLNSKLNESSDKSETIPQIIKWIGSTVFLFKATKEFMKKYEKPK